MKPLDLTPAAARLLVGFKQTPAPKSAAAVMEEYCARTGFTPEQLKGPDRHRSVAHARQELMALLREQTDKSTTWIGRFLGGRDHTTVLHGVKRHKARAASK